MGTSYAVLSLPLFTSAGILWTDPPYAGFADASLTLPAPTITAALTQSETATADLELPALTAEGTILYGSAHTAALELPLFILDASLATGWLAEGIITFPAFTIAANNTERVATAALNLPRISSTGTLLNGVTGQAALTLPVLTISAIGVPNHTGTAAIILPNLTLYATIGYGQSLSADLELPLFSISATLAAGHVLTANISLPILTISAGLGPSLITMTGAITLPALIVEAILTQDLLADFALGTAEFGAYVFNTRSFGLSSYANFGFNSFAKAGDVYLGANQNGIYSLNASTDAGANINAEITKERVDMGTGHDKRSGDFYLGLRKGGNFTLELTFESQKGSYSLQDETETPHRFRIKTGKGLKGAYFDFKLQNVAGGDFTINDIELNLDLLSRKER